MNIVDRRPNPKGKSRSNRQRFLARARAEVKSAVQEALRKRKVADVGHGEKVAIPTRGIAEPNFHHSRRTGRTEHVVPGNKEYIRGDEIPRPTGGEGRGGSQGSPDGSGEDAFEFTLSKEEFLDMFFEDLELPDLVKKSLKETFAGDLQRAGYTVTGSPANLSIRRTMRNSMARRISLKRPKQSDLEALREAIDNARSRGADGEAERRLRAPDRLQHRRRGRRRDVLLQPGDRRHRSLDRARENAGDCAGAISHRPVEHLRGSGFRRRQLRRGQRTLRFLAGQRGSAALPVFRLCRSRRRHGREPDRIVARQRPLASLQRGGAGPSSFRDAPGQRPVADFLGVPRIVRKGGYPCLTPSRCGSKPPPRSSPARIGIIPGCAGSTTLSSGSRSTNSGSTSLPSRSR